MEKLENNEIEDLKDLKQNHAYKLFLEKIVTPEMNKCRTALDNLTTSTEKEGPILAAQLRVLRKIFFEMNDAISVKRGEGNAR